MKDSYHTEADINALVDAITSINPRSFNAIVAENHKLRAELARARIAEKERT